MAGRMSTLISSVAVGKGEVYRKGDGLKSSCLPCARAQTLDVPSLAGKVKLTQDWVEGVGEPLRGPLLEGVPTVESPLNTIHCGDCVEGMRRLPAGLVDLAFADPPFNIGYEYDIYQDNRAHQAYLD